MKRRILVFCDYYLPGIKGGGGMWAVRNLVDRFKDKYDFFICTRNHDGRDDLTPFDSVVTDEWNDIFHSRCLYLSPEQITPRRIAAVVSEVRPDMVFLNSVFSKPVVTYLTARRRGLFDQKIPSVIATCGELSAATLRMKRAKKTVFLAAAKAVKLYKGLIFRASFDAERAEIESVFGRNTEIHIAPDLTPSEILPDYSIDDKPDKFPGSVRLAFVSRIVRKKNLSFLLSLLGKIEMGKIELDIAGNNEDAGYWSECSAMIGDPPANVTVRFHGPVDNETALKILVGSHFFVLPTLNENFGYVFIEALAAGCALIISDQTVWKGLSEKGIGWDLSLDDESKWADAIRAAVAMDNAEFETMSERCRSFAIEWQNRPENTEATARLLETALERSPVTDL